MTNSKGVAAARRVPVVVEGAQDQRADPDEQEALVDADLDTLATALYVRTDDLLKAAPERAPWRPKVGIEPQISDAELITLAVMAALLRFTSEARWLRHARVHLRHQLVDRRCMGGRLDPGRMRSFSGDRAALGPGRLRRVRLLRQPLPLLLGPAPAPDRDPARTPGRVRADRGEGR